ncbi:hypothetical protein ACFX1X_023010 [Malus domestica]
MLVRRGHWREVLEKTNPFYGWTETQKSCLLEIIQWMATQLHLELGMLHTEKVLSEAYRVLKRGGRFLCLELNHVDIPVFKEFYDYYSFSVIPALGELVAGDRESYQYLVESIRRFPPQYKLALMIADAGFQQVEYENLVGGVVAIHSRLKV